IDEKLAFQNCDKAISNNNEYVTEQTFRIYNRSWSLKINPTEKFLKQEEVVFPFIFLMGGISVSLLLAVLAYFLRISIINVAHAEETRRRFSLAVKGAQDGIWDWPDITKDEQYWSPHWKHLLGYEDHEIQGSYQTFKTLLHPDDVEPTEKSMKEHFENDVPYNVEYRLKNKSGKYIWFRAKATTVRDDNGRPIRMVGSIRDVSGRKKNEQILIQHAEEIRDSQARLESVLDTVLDGIITINSSGIIQSVNAAVERLFLYEIDELIGQNVKMLMPNQYSKNHDIYLKNYLKTGEAKIIGSGREVEGMRRDGSTFPIELGVNEVFIAGERMFVGNIHNISERKKAESDLIEAKEEAEQATRMKSEFLANMSHEIRTPMNGIIGMANLLLETDLDAKQKTYAKTAISSAENLLQLVNDILDFSKIEAGKLEFETISFDLRLLVEEVADLIAIKAQEKGLEVLLRFAPDIPRYIVGDPGRVRQIFLNLASNSLKFTETGYVLIGVDAKKHKGGKVIFHGYVEDTGIGIPEDKQDYIFNKFSQADSSTTRKFGGTGLGLAICKELSHNMKGDIGVESTLGVGSTFWFTFQLPVDEKTKGGGVYKVPTDLSGIRAIIVDDNKVAQDIAAEYMRKAKMKVTIASSGKEALDLMQEAADKGKPFELGVLDYIMPQMGGLELAKKIKKSPKLKNISLLMVSSEPSRKDSKLIKEGKFQGCLTKPSSGLEIIRALDLIQSMRQKKVPLSVVTRDMLREADAKEDKAKTDSVSFDGAQILLAEDNPTNQMVATTMLEKMGCVVTPASNGLEVVKLIKQRRFDLIFMDCNMPEMDGFEATQSVRKLEKQGEFDKIPIVAFTAYAMKGDDQKCYDAGMDDYITKPVKKQAMVDVLKKWLP
ncbi:MAG: response regulator, partial [Alphaproteobacteria bacterium]|nr:response regulator [Alphaproteobacteria bacterium]